MKRRFIILFVIYFLTNIQAQDKTYLIFDEPCNDSLPVHFRKSTDEFHFKSDILPDRTGLEILNASGSAEFCSQSLAAMLKNIGHEKITVVDLRQESHGFINGICISIYGEHDWGNAGLSRQEVVRDEKRMLDSLFKIKNILVTQIIKKDKASNEIKESKEIPVTVNTIQTEEELTEAFKTGYFRITATDHRKPVDSDVDRFIEFVNDLDINTWLHFHCHAGDGRTTTFLVMYDMIRNAKKVSSQNIIQRQYLLGGIDLSKDDDYPVFDKQYAIERTEFLNNFYEYCKSNNDNYKTLYSDWKKQK